MNYFIALWVPTVSLKVVPYYYKIKIHNRTHLIQIAWI